MKIRSAVLLATLPFAACQEVEQPTTVLTQEQWNEVKQYILSEAPEPAYKVGANFGNKIELIGFDVTEPLTVGKKATFTWYWRAIDNVGEDWQIFIHFDSAVKPARQNLDHVPVRNMYQTGRWKKGQIIKDVQEVTIRRDFPAGKATPFIGLYRGEKRMPVTNDVPKDDAAQPRVVGPTLMVQAGANASATPATPKPPKYAARKLGEADAQSLQIDGKLDEPVWARVPPLRLTPFGNAQEQATTVKIAMTEDSLIIGAQLADKHVWGTLESRDDETWREEVLEVFLDVDGDGKDYMELQITPRNTIFDARFPVRLGTGQGSRDEQIVAAKAWNMEGLKSAVHVDGTVNDDGDEDRSWTVELLLPIASIPGLDKAKPAAGDKWAINFYRFDRPKEGTTWAYAWSTAPRGDFHQVDKFGVLEIAPIVDVNRPKVTPQMLQQMRKNIDLKVRPALKAPAQMPKPVVNAPPQAPKAPAQPAAPAQTK